MGASPHLILTPTTRIKTLPLAQPETQGHILGNFVSTSSHFVTLGNVSLDFSR